MACRLLGVESSSTVLAVHLNDQFDATTGQVGKRAMGWFLGFVDASN